MKIIFKKQAINLAEKLKNEMTLMLKSHGIKPKEKDLIILKNNFLKLLGGKK